MMASNSDIDKPLHTALPDRTGVDSQEDSQQHGQSQIPSDETPAENPQPQAVRFSSVNQEIEPAQMTLSATTHSSIQQQMTPEAQADLRSISVGMHNSQLQQRRMSNFAFEPVSLPVSRAPSNEPSPHSSRQPTRSTNVSPLMTPRHSENSPGPHVDADTGAPSAAAGPELAKVHADAIQVAPQPLSPSEIPPAVASDASISEANVPSSTPTTRPSSASDHTSTRPTTLSQGSSMADAFAKHAPISREGSPSRAHGSATPPNPYIRPYTPRGNEDDPYARSKRRPQAKPTDVLDNRFIFEGTDARRRSAMGSGSVTPNSGPLPRSSSGNDARNQEKRQSTFSLHGLGGKKDDQSQRREETAIGSVGKHHHGSMTDLKRFFGIGHHKAKRGHSPAASSKKQAATGSKTPPHSGSSVSVPFADDHGLATKYGKFGKVLGSGAGGSVRLMKRQSDGVTFAVKQFRDRHSYETEREYSKKVTAEFCIGSTLHHGNVIETLDIVHERDHWYEVMEYAPYDLFAVVMTGKMSREEISCSFLQIVRGVHYLHDMGLAHRDLKLDNVVVNEHGIMKLIDFGSAAVFRYPFETDIVLANGIVGSDPYLAPETYDIPKYDPQPTDIWSLAIIFACMSLRRFPWKAPRFTDNSYKLFASTPTPGLPTVEGPPWRISNNRAASTVETPAATQDPRRSSAPAGNVEGQESSHNHHHHGQTKQDKQEQSAGTGSDQPQQQQQSKPEVIRGPWRLLRLLPRESRAIIGRMLEISPKKRATLEEMMTDSWIADTPVCSQTEGAQINRAPGHQHTLEPGNVAQPAEG
ncbi:MAG: hypothetical protein Q9174_001146 [Haloplaca sp. 1 TL-2023]